MRRSMLLICFCTALIIISFESVHAQEYTIIQLDPPSTNFYNFSSATAINNAGVVIGNGSAMYTTDIICVWKPGQPYPDQHYFHGYNRTTAEGINDKGNLVGYGPAADGTHGFLNSTDLGLGKALGINNRDQVVGWTSDSSYIYENGVFNYLPTSYWGSEPVAINDSGIAVGYWITDCDNSDCYEEACIFRNDSLILIGRLGGNYARATDINNRGQIVGWSCINSDCLQYRGFIWNNGVWTTIPTLGGDGSQANAINDDGILVGEARTASNAQHAFIYDSSHGLRDLNDLIPQGSGWELYYATDINKAGQIVGVGRINGLTRGFLLNPTGPGEISITNPIEDALAIAGEKDTIRWEINGVIDSVRIKVILNWHLVLPTEIVIAESVPAYDEQFEWNIPDTLLSYKTKIKIEDKNDPSNFAESESFRLKGYVLTRVKIIDSTYEAFTSNFHGWNYLNGTLWPSTWWTQFNYSIALDPYTNDPYPKFFHSIAASTFIDWPLWVEVFSEDNCYWSTILINIYKGKAEQKWKSSCGVHGGSCFGFAASSFLAFNFRNQFFTKHPQIQNVGNIFGLPLDSIIQKTTNGYWAFQFGKQSLDNDVIGQPKNPRATLIEIMNMFIGDSVDIRTITIYNNGGGGGGAHTMAPIRISKDNTGPSRYRLHLYDSNNPAVDSFYILIDSLNNTWTDFTGLGPTWTGNSHFYLEIPVSNYLNTPTIGKKLSKSPDDVKGTGYIEFYNTEKANIIFTSPNGQRIGLTNGAVTNEIQDGIAIFNKNGKPSDPIGYYVPDDDYSVVLSNIIDTSETFYLTALKENLTYDYTRDNVNSSQTDRLRIGDGFSVMSTDLEEKEFNLKLISDLNSGERIFSIANTQIRQNDSLFIDELNQSELVLKNYGTEKSYNLELDERSPQSQKVFKHVSLTLQDNSSQTLLPDWDNLNQSFLKILIDLGNDGTIDDSLEVVNQATGIGDDQGSLLSPDSYNLAQNYPNPFNPTTTIRYAIPLLRGNERGVSVKLIVYDVLGNEVATLVDEYKPAGNYEVEFNAENLSSGVYFYKIQAGEYVSVKKMILLR